MPCKVSVIIVNWNGKALLQDCLSGLRRQIFQDFDTIFVDNGSADDSVSYVQQEFPEARIISLPENQGFSGGNAAGLQVATGDYIALLNNDAIPDPGWLAALVDTLREYEEAGICASRLMVWNTDLVDSAGDDYTTAGIALKRGNGETVGNYLERRFVFGACAGAALYRRTMIDEVGFFDPDFFLVNEDTDLNFRAQLRGWKCVYVPEAVVYHKVSTTRKRESHKMVYFNVRNADAALLKNMPSGLILRYLHHILIGQVAGFIKFGLLQREWNAVLRAKLHTLLSVPALLRKRRAIQRDKTVSNAYIAANLRDICERDFLRNRIRAWKKG